MRNTGFLQSEGEMLPGLEFYLFSLCDWLVGFKVVFHYSPKTLFPDEVKVLMDRLYFN